MINALIIAELGEDGSLKRGTLSAIAFARKAGELGSLDILVLGASTQAASQELAKYGAGKVIRVEDPSLTHYVAERFSPTVAEIAKGYQLVLAAASSFGKDLLPRVAARLGAGYAGDCADLQVEGGKLSFKRPMFAGNVYGYCQLDGPIALATVRQSEVDPSQPVQAQSPIEQAALTPPTKAAERVQFVTLDAVKSARPELSDAKVVVSGGRALKERFFEIMEPLADALGAALGASRAAVDAGYCPGDFQVGQTGKIVAPSLYVAVGISGAIQHIAGMKGSKVIVAINKDPDAPIFQIADYGLVADLFGAVPEMVRAIKG
jgi:electron transfer flavoprotein alpha subunit